MYMYLSAQYGANVTDEGDTTFTQAMGCEITIWYAHLHTVNSNVDLASTQSSLHVFLSQLAIIPQSHINELLVLLFDWWELNNIQMYVNKQLLNLWNKKSLNIIFLKGFVYE